MTRTRSLPAVLMVLVTGAVLVAAGCRSGEPRSANGGTPAAGDPTATGSEPVSVATEAPVSGPWTARPPTAPAGEAVVATLATPDGRDRSYRLYRPSGLVAGRPVPLVVALHGGLGSAEQFERDSGFDGEAEANGFIVVYPDGVGSAIKDDFGQTWNGGNCCGPAVRQQVDDVAFLRTLVDTVSHSEAIDPQRIYAVGHSNGGIMAYRLACEAADVFAGIGVQSSSLELSPCSPARPVSVIHIHGTADRNLPIAGGMGQGVSGVDFQPPIDGVHTLAAADRCPSEPTTAVDPDNPDVTVDTWSPCGSGTEVRFVRVAGASHAWMGGSREQRPAQRALVGPVYDRYSTTEAIWSFLAAHPRA